MYRCGAKSATAPAPIAAAVLSIAPATTCTSAGSPSAAATSAFSAAEHRRAGTISGNLSASMPLALHQPRRRSGCRRGCGCRSPTRSGSNRTWRQSARSGAGSDNRARSGICRCAHRPRGNVSRISSMCAGRVLAGHRGHAAGQADPAQQLEQVRAQHVDRARWPAGAGRARRACPSTGCSSSARSRPRRPGPCLRPASNSTRP